jgi:hypothetical protein
MLYEGDLPTPSGEVEVGPSDLRNSFEVGLVAVGEAAW